MGTDTTLGEEDDWLVDHEDGRWVVYSFSRHRGRALEHETDSKHDAKHYVKERGHGDDVVTVFTRSGEDYDTRYVRELDDRPWTAAHGRVDRGSGLFDDLGF